MSKKINSLRGFTLLELIVVIAIIGVLSVLILPSFTTALARARDGRKISELRGLQAELVQWSQNNNGLFPANAAMPSQTAGCGSVVATASLCAILTAGIDNRLPTGVYLNSLTAASSTYNYNGVACYAVPAGGLCQSYTLWTDLEKSNSALSNDADGFTTAPQSVWGASLFLTAGTVPSTSTLPTLIGETCTGVFGTCIFDLAP